MTTVKADTASTRRPQSGAADIAARVENKLGRNEVSGTVNTHQKGLSGGRPNQGQTIAVTPSSLSLGVLCCAERSSVPRSSVVSLPRRRFTPRVYSFIRHERQALPFPQRELPRLTLATDVRAEGTGGSESPSRPSSGP